MDRVLVVDDDASIRGVVVEVLRDDGHAVVEAGSGEEALGHCAEEGFDLVLTDIRMPGIDGITLLERLRERYPAAHVVVMTSHASVDTAVGALKRGAYDYLSKPFESLDIISEVAKRALHNVRLIRERESLIATMSKNNRELEKLNRFFRELAIRDGLTGLYNHRHLHEVLHVEVERARRYGRELALVFADVDHFKRYNDTHGHQHGDQVLRSIAEILRRNVRETDIVARWGGEEFVIVAPETRAGEGVEIAEKLRHLVAQFPFHGREAMPGGSVTISAGVAVLQPGLTQETLVRSADEAVYRAKERGRNLVCLAA
jgi:two-component system, cell cycle response regulator